MLVVTVDMYCGLPNPSWLVEDEGEVREVLRDLARHQDAIAEEGSGYHGLGYRGFIIQIADDSLAQRWGLPDHFRLANGGSANESQGLAIAEQFLAQMPVGILTLGGQMELTEDIRRQISEHLAAHPRVEVEETTAPAAVAALPQPTAEGEAPGPEHHRLASAQAACAYWATRFNPAFWNRPDTQPYNNCYNYAVNRRTNTFAQPGRASGFTATMNCASVIQGATLDGAHWWGNCFPPGTGGIWVMALVVAPGYDYHWYRYSAEGFWGHKPGSTPARNTDNAGNIVYSPYYASRWPYTDFCGYFQCAYTMRIR
jgi:hypothetical protein